MTTSGAAGPTAAAQARTALGQARTLLFVPADRPERFVKAVAAGADAGIVDSEDSVWPERLRGNPMRPRKPPEQAQSRRSRGRAPASIGNNEWACSGGLPEGPGWPGALAGVAMGDATRYTNAIAQKENGDALAAIKASGKTQIIELDEKQRAAWRKALAAVYKEMEPRVGKGTIARIRKEAAALGYK